VVVLDGISSAQCKWALNLPFETQRRYNAKLQLAIPIIINIPAIYFERYGLEKLKGFVEDEEDEKIEKIDSPKNVNLLISKK
jgi:hypothetical protein